MKSEKIAQMNKIEELEKIILALEGLEIGEKLDPEIEYIVGEVRDEVHKKEKIRFYKENISAIKRSTPDDGKLYLSEIVAKEKTKFGSNNLILAPVGSGKTTLIRDLLIKDEPEKVLMLVSNTALKNSISPNDNELKKVRADRTYTSQNKSVYGDKSYEIHVMSYAEFGKLVKTNNEFIDNIKQIFCDEIHSLPNYQGYSDSTNLSHAIKSLFSKYEDKEIYYFTATDEYLLDLEKRQPGALKHTKIFDFRGHPDIKKYLPLSEYKFNHIEQIRPHLRARLENFNYFGHKGLAFSRTIAGQKRIAEIAFEEGFNPLVLWSVNNIEEGNKMDDEQLRARSILLNNGVIPEPYNILIINSAMQEGWDLYDPKVKLAIMNTTSETEKVQALGRLRNDIDVLAYKVGKNEAAYVDVTVPEKYLNTPLTSKQKEEMCIELNIFNANGTLSKWRMIRTFLEDLDSGYEVFDHSKTINKLRTRVTTISFKEDIE